MPPDQARTESGLGFPRSAPAEAEPPPESPGAADSRERGEEEFRREEELRRSHAQLRALSARLLRVREEERSHVAREIHDELGQALTGLKLDLSWLADGLPESQRPLRSRIRAIARRVEETIRTVRRIATTLRPGLLDDLGLAAALEWQAQEFQAHTGIRLRFASSLRDARLDRDLSTSVFRIFQEALTNVARHSRATFVDVRVREETGRLLLAVHDNGRGITEAERSDRGSLGLLGMRERALAFGGELDVTGGPRRGTEVTLRVPLGPGDGAP